MEDGCEGENWVHRQHKHFIQVKLYLSSNQSRSHSQATGDNNSRLAWVLIHPPFSSVRRQSAQSQGCGGEDFGEVSNVFNDRLLEMLMDTNS